MSNNTTFPYPPIGPVGDWWTALVVIVIFNNLFYAFTLYKTRKSHYEPPPHPKHIWSYRYSTCMRLLAFPFVFQTTWRSFLPSKYNERITIIDGEINSILVARMLAFVGEICWGIQIGWALGMISANLPLKGSPKTNARLRKGIRIVAYIIPLFAIIANCCSVAGTVTTNFALALSENSFWTAIFFFGGISSMLLWHFGCDSFSYSWGSNCFGWDINPFDDRWYRDYANDQAAGKVYFEGPDAFNDAFYRQIPSQAYLDWYEDMFWMGAYFSAGVWASILLAYAPGRIEKCNCDDPNLPTGQPITAANNA